MALAAYLAFLGAACALALADWRRAWLLLLVCGAVQDPVRKLTPGTPVVISFSVVALYGCILFGARNELLAELRDFSRRFTTIYKLGFTFVALLLLCALNGFFTYGVENWKVPLLGLFTYLAPVPAMLLGYAYLRREELLYRVFAVYATITSIALVGTLLEYYRVSWPTLGMVAFSGMDYIRHLPGIQIRMLSGFYRGPDIMAWHAAMLTSVGAAMALRAADMRGRLIWVAAAGWGFTACMLGGRRKAIYFVVVFLGALLWRYFRRLQNAQIVAVVGVALVMGGVIRHLAANEETSVYTRGAVASEQEIFERLEGGTIETFREFGLMGAGLGTATQGAQHLLRGQAIGWQEGGLGKLAIEVGLPGLLWIALLGLVAMRMLLLLTRIGDVRGSSQFARAALFAFMLANVATFMASAQAYTDAILGILTAFLVGCLFATAALDERLPAEEAAAAPQQRPQLTAAATA
ncbi:MAG TPA: hypothetical protein VF824_07270 [Thermoanaerobaculia bacterium]|jgi:hypothetical protein